MNFVHDYQSFYTLEGSVICAVSSQRQTSDTLAQTAKLHCAGGAGSQAIWGILATEYTWRFSAAPTNIARLCRPLPSRAVASDKYVHVNSRSSTEALSAEGTTSSSTRTLVQGKMLELVSRLAVTHLCVCESLSIRSEFYKRHA